MWNGAGICGNSLAGYPHNIHLTHLADAQPQLPAIPQVPHIVDIEPHQLRGQAIGGYRRTTADRCAPIDTGTLYRAVVFHLGKTVVDAQL